MSAEGWPSPRTLLAAHGLKPKKAWGQNFLADLGVRRQIVRLLNPAADALVVELGAGLGHLTAALLETESQVVAVERDRELVSVLESAFSGQERVRILAADAKRIDLGTLLAPGQRAAVVGNLPYHISTPILFHLLESRAQIARLVVMVQREVGERMAAPPGGKDYGILAIRFGLDFSVSCAFDVPSSCFVPAPAVVSSVINLRPRPAPLAEVGDRAFFAKLVKAAFSQRRKKLLNALRKSALFDAELVVEAFAQTGLDGTLRPERIPIEGFAALSLAMQTLAGRDPSGGTEGEDPQAKPPTQEGPGSAQG